MIIRTLIENTLEDERLSCEHGLSLDIQTDHHHILFDTGASGRFLNNAATMGIDIAAVDAVIISHGHYDHGGGIRTFLQHNQKAQIYLNRQAFGDYYSEKADGVKRYIGLDKTLLPNERLVLVGPQYVIDQGLTLYAGLQGNQLRPKNNDRLYVKTPEGFVHDPFVHEQHLVIEEAGNIVLFMGCAHGGVVNIIENLRIHTGIVPTHVIGGFHLYSHGTDCYEDDQLIEQLGEYLAASGITFFTGHCTGPKAYTMIKAHLHDKISYLATGSQITI